MTPRPGGQVTECQIPPLCIITLSIASEEATGKDYPLLMMTQILVHLLLLYKSCAGLGSSWILFVTKNNLSPCASYRVLHFLGILIKSTVIWNCGNVLVAMVTLLW